MTQQGVDPLATPVQFLKGVGPRRAADLEHAGLLTVEDLLYRFPAPLRRPQPAPADRDVEVRPDGGRVGPCARQQRTPIDAAAGIQDLRSGDRRRHRIDASGVAEPAVPQRHLHARPARRALRTGRGARFRQPPNHQPAIRDSRRRRRRNDPYGTDRAGVRKNGDGHAEDATPARLRCAPEAASRVAGSAARRRSPAARASVAVRGLDGHALSTGRCRGGDIERVCDTGSAPADLRRGVQLSDGRARAPADRGGRAQAPGPYAWTTASATRRAPCSLSS